MLSDEEGNEDAADDGQHDSPPSKRPRRLAWAQLMRRVLDIDVLICPKCAASMVIIVFITDPSVLTRILDHLKLPSTPPPLAPARSPIDGRGAVGTAEPWGRGKQISA